MEEQPVPVEEKLPDRIRIHRHRLRLSQAEAGDLFGVSDATWSRLEAGIGLGTMTPRRLRKLAEWLGEDLGALVREIDDHFTMERNDNAENR